MLNTYMDESTAFFYSMTLDDLLPISDLTLLNAVSYIPIEFIIKANKTSLTLTDKTLKAIISLIKKEFKSLNPYVYIGKTNSPAKFNLYYYNRNNFILLPIKTDFITTPSQSNYIKSLNDYIFYLKDNRTYSLPFSSLFELIPDYFKMDILYEELNSFSQIDFSDTNFNQAQIFLKQFSHTLFKINKYLNYGDLQRKKRIIDSICNFIQTIQTNDFFKAQEKVIKELTSIHNNKIQVFTFLPTITDKQNPLYQRKLYHPNYIWYFSMDDALLSGLNQYTLGFVMTTTIDIKNIVVLDYINKLPFLIIHNLVATNISIIKTKINSMDIGDEVIYE
ncbi:MAG: hypothetical protein RSC93_02570 [Erysipelotrichaceae bacterium]